MFTKSQTDALALLDKYFSETPKHIIEAEVQAVSELNFAGTSAKDYFASFHTHWNYEPFPKTKLPVNKLSTFFTIEDNFLYIKHVKSSNYLLKEYNFMNTLADVPQYAKKNISILPLIQV